MTPADTVAAYMERAHTARTTGATYTAQEWERAADELARVAYGTDARALMAMRLIATATVSRGGAA